MLSGEIVAFVKMDWIREINKIFKLLSCLAIVFAFVSCASMKSKKFSGKCVLRSSETEFFTYEGDAIVHGYKLGEVPMEACLQCGKLSGNKIRLQGVVKDGKTDEPMPYFCIYEIERNDADYKIVRTLVAGGKHSRVDCVVVFDESKLYALTEVGYRPILFRVQFPKDGNDSTPLLIPLQ